MRDLCAASFEEFIAWYLRREARKGNRVAYAGTAGELRAEMNRVHPGKLRPWFPQAVWRMVELTEPDEILSLVCVDGPDTRRNGLVGSLESNPRILRRVVENARRAKYFDNGIVAARDPGEYSKRQRKIEAFRSEWPSLAGDERIVLCAMNSGELCENPSGSYYLHDGFGRLLACAYMVAYESRKFTPIEAFLASK